MHNLAKNDLFEERYSTILFEPKELINFQVAWDWQKEWQKKLIFVYRYHAAETLLNPIFEFQNHAGPQNNAMPSDSRRPRQWS